LKSNLPSVYEAIKTVAVPYEIIVSDDASTDHSVSFLKEKHPDIAVIENKLNRGFSPTINEGIKVASKELILLLNTDVELEKEALCFLLPYFDRSDTFGVTFKMIGLGDSIIQDGGKYPKSTLSKKIQPINFYCQQYQSWIPTLYLSGGASLVNTKKLQCIGGFDEIYSPFYVEDLDLSLRAWRVGWRCYYEQKAVCLHPVSATIGSYHKQRSVWLITQRNKLILHAIHLSFYAKLFWYSRQALTLVVQAIALRWKYHQSFILFLRRRKLVLKSKRTFESKFKLQPTEKILANLRGEIEKLKIITFK
jgi:GT2 family glycosyltransferase